MDMESLVSLLLQRMDWNLPVGRGERKDHLRAAEMLINKDLWARHWISTTSMEQLRLRSHRAALSSVYQSSTKKRFNPQLLERRKVQKPGDLRSRSRLFLVFLPFKNQSNYLTLRYVFSQSSFPLNLDHSSSGNWYLIVNEKKKKLSISQSSFWFLFQSMFSRSKCCSGQCPCMEAHYCQG